MLGSKVKIVGKELELTALSEIRHKQGPINRHGGQTKFTCLARGQLLVKKFPMAKHCGKNRLGDSFSHVAQEGMIIMGTNVSCSMPAS